MAEKMTKIIDDPDNTSLGSTSTEASFASTNELIIQDDDGGHGAPLDINENGEARNNLERKNEDEARGSVNTINPTHGQKTQSEKRLIKWGNHRWTVFLNFWRITDQKSGF